MEPPIKDAPKEDYPHCSEGNLIKYSNRVIDISNSWLSWFYVLLALAIISSNYILYYYSLSLYRGLDPIVFAGLCGAASAVVGYMLGGTIFTSVWRTLSRKKSAQLNQVHS